MDELCESLRYKRAKPSPEETGVVDEPHTHTGNVCDAALDVDAVLADVDDRHVLVFDTETTGLRGTVIQFACIIATHAGEEKHVYDEYWHTSETIDPRAVEVHRIDADTLRRHGLVRAVEVQRVVDLLERAHANGCELVAHNAAFDVEALLRTARAHGIPMQLTRDDVRCTMRLSRQVCDLTNKVGRLKNPTNVELYACLFGSAPPHEERLHNAKVDARITLASFLHGRFRGYW